MIFKKIQFTININNTNITILLKNEVMNGVAYFDQIQIDHGFIDQRYNYLENASFENTLSGWTYSGASVVNNYMTGPYLKVLKDSTVRLSLQKMVKMLNMFPVLVTLKSYLIKKTEW